MDYQRMHHDEIDREAWDRPPRETPPARRVVICSTPRSGSYLLCRQMIHAGLGVPTEYFRARTLARLSARWGVRRGDDSAYLDALEARRTSANGVFAAKFQWFQLVHHRIARDRLIDRADLLIHLTRRDVVAQAVSWQVSLATGFWSFDATPGRRAPDMTLDDSDETQRLASLLVDQDRGWETLLAKTRGPVLRVTYEAYKGDQEALLRQIAGELGLPAEAWTLPPPEPGTSRLPDDIEVARERLLVRARAAHAAAGR
ncbi:MAG: Stf0 family sulfotransferase [Betaproteobacteria bacterium]